MELTFEPIVKNEQGEYHVKITNAGNTPVFHQLNNVSLSVHKDQNEAVLTGDVASLDAFNDAILEYANGHSEDWFGRKVAEGTLKKAFQSDVDDGLTVDVNSELGVKYFSQDKELKDSGDLLQEDLYAHVILELQGLWFVKKNFGPVWRLVQVKDAPPPPKKSPYDEYLFQDA